MNLRERYLPYKYLVAQILKDKNKLVRTVINKVENVGSHDEFRTFPFEVLAGDNDTKVTHHEQGCEFQFDFARVYWNSRLEAEHRRLVRKFAAGELVCDVMAGVGPFAIPAGKKTTFVLANDLNPYCYEGLKDAIKRNKVGQFVRAYNVDGREFIRSSAELLSSPYTVRFQPKPRRDMNRVLSSGKHPIIPSAPIVLRRPRVPSHYVMNLPASAIDFLDAFVGLYRGKEEQFAPYTSHRLPMVHVYCFVGFSEEEDDKGDRNEVCQRISDRLGYTITPKDEDNPDAELEVHYVRTVSRHKRMYCASFRLPKEVAFREEQ